MNKVSFLPLDNLSLPEDVQKKYEHVGQVISVQIAEIKSFIQAIRAIDPLKMTGADNFELSFDAFYQKALPAILVDFLIYSGVVSEDKRADFINRSSVSIVEIPKHKESSPCSCLN